MIPLDCEVNDVRIGLGMRLSEPDAVGLIHRASFGRLGLIGKFFFRKLELHERGDKVLFAKNPRIRLLAGDFEISANLDRTSIDNPKAMTDGLRVGGLWGTSAYAIFQGEVLCRLFLAVIENTEAALWAVSTLGEKLDAHLASRKVDDSLYTDDQSFVSVDWIAPKSALIGWCMKLD